MHDAARKFVTIFGGFCCIFTKWYNTMYARIVWIQVNESIVAETFIALC